MLLPDYLLRVVLAYVPYEDFISVAQSRSVLTPFVKPRLKTITRRRSTLHGPDLGESNDTPWFDVHLRTDGLHYIKMSFTWCDQGVGTSHACVILELVRNGRVLEYDWTWYGEHAEQSWKKREVILNNHPITQRAVRGDILRVKRNAVGDGPGDHVLQFRNFEMTLVLETPCENDGDEDPWNKGGKACCIIS